MPSRRCLLAALAALPALLAIAGPRILAAAPAVSSNVKEQLAAASARLKLTPEQEAQLHPILEERSTRMHAIRDQYVGDTSREARRAMFEDARLVQKDYEGKVRAVLTPEQEKEWEKMRKEGRATLREQYREGKAPE